MTDSSWETLEPGVLHRLDVEVKKSRFLVHAWGGVPTAEAALALVRGAADARASHNCWAYRLGPSEARSSDDGEPGGTAGRPILAAIDGEGLSRVAVLVVRHFGGVKLGTGGLARAYGGAARECLRGAPRVRSVARAALRVAAPAAAAGAVRRAAAGAGAEVAGEAYSDDGGEVELLLRVDAGDAAARLRGALAAATAGAARVEDAGVT